MTKGAVHIVQGGWCVTHQQPDASCGRLEAAPERPTCPDGGTCHHECEQGRTRSGVVPCWRVREAGPLSAAGYPGDRWPEAVVREHTPPLTTGDLWNMLDLPAIDTMPMRAVMPDGSVVLDVVGATWEDGHVHLRLREAVRACPECQAGKCGNWTDEAWDTVADEATTCPCALLAHPRRTA